jgi:PEP-CTERM motif-containing protein
MQLMKTSAKLLMVAVLAFGFAARASAQVTWTFSDVTFTGGYTLTGSFTTNAAVNTITSASVSITGPTAFSTTTMSSAYLATPELGIFAPSPSLAYVDLFPLSFLTNAGGIIPLTSGFDCPGSGGCPLLITSGASPEIIGVTPEPATAGLMLLGFGLLVGVGVLRRATAKNHAL